MTKNRRTLAGMMSAKHEAFISGASPRMEGNLAAVADEAPEPPSTRERPVAERRGRPRAAPSRRTPVAPPPLPQAMAGLKASITTRLEPATVAALRRAALERRLRGEPTATVQEIVEEAVSEWLMSRNCQE